MDAVKEPSSSSSPRAKADSSEVHNVTNKKRKAESDSPEIHSLTNNKREAIMPIEQDDEELMNDVSDNDGGSDMDDSDNQLLDLEDSDYEYDEPIAYDDEALALQAKFDSEDLPPGAEASVPWLVVEDKQPTDPTRPPVPCSSSAVPKQFEVVDDDDEVMLKFRSFKTFDTVVDLSDHLYKSERVTEATQASSKWTKAIQQDWRLLKKDLPDTIFVRAYEERMDLLRAVIVGAAGTPYHDGLFFFDVYFPSQYPDTPPLVKYHAHNLRINPNLYDNGYVCLSLLNTWEGSKVERWTPGKSNMLQVLLSIQALVLNEEPFYNEPGYARRAGSGQGNKQAQVYNESTFILSCRTMLYTLKNPPMHFEDYVLGHFRLRAETILSACKGYIEGVQIGCVAEAVQVANEQKSGTSSMSKRIGASLEFKKEVGTMAGNIVPVFIQKGAKNCEQFICLGDSYRLDKANYTDIFKKDFYNNPAEQGDAALESQAQAESQADYYNYGYYGHGHGQTSAFHAQLQSQSYAELQAQAKAQGKPYYGSNYHY